MSAGSRKGPQEGDSTKSRESGQDGAHPEDLARAKTLVGTAERQYERLRHLYEISKRLTRFETLARTVPEILALLSESVPLRTAILMVEQGAEPKIRIRAITWHADGVSTSRLREARAHAKTAYAYLVRTALTFEDEPGATRIPSIPPQSGVHPSRFVFLPLIVERGRIFGALQLEGADRLDEPDLLLVNAVVNQLAIALDRVAVIESKQATVKAALRAAEFLADASATLFSSLEYEKTIAAVVHAAVPPFADMCFLDQVGEDGRLHRIAIEFADAGKECGVDRARPSEAAFDSEIPQSEALRTGEPVLLTDDDLAARNRAAESELGDLGIQSMMAVPLIARGRGLGVLTFVAAESGRRYSASDMALAEEIGRRAAIAIDNAQLYEQAQKAIRARQDVLAIVSHDLTNPLGAILMMAEHLTEVRPTDDPAARKRAIHVIQRSAQRMNRLIADLLDVASIDAGHLAVETKAHPVSPLVREAVELHRAAAAQKELQLEGILPDAELEIDCDRGRVLQVFGNLIGNAIKFTPNGGSIKVCAQPCGEETLFFVSDCGPGIEADELSHVFDRFWQARTAARVGTGLGLTIAKGLVEAQGGRIWAESTVGQGATFFFTIPKVR
jgi:signal transduction histidine kinase